MSWIKGAHSFRFGFEYSKYDINHFQPQASNGPRGGFNFTGGLTSLNGGAATTGYNSWARLPAGPAAGHGQGCSVRESGDGAHAVLRLLCARCVAGDAASLPSTTASGTKSIPAPRAITCAGERYDPNTDKVYRGGYDTGIGQLAPRLGIAWRLNEKTVIRDGAGISVDPNTFRYLRDDYPATISTQYTGSQCLPGGGNAAHRHSGSW